MNKYNEIMNNVSVDPAMKTRIMSAVSAAIKEQDSGTVNAEAVRKPEIRRTPEPAHISEIPKEEPQAPVRKKAKKTPPMTPKLKKNSPSTDPPIFVYPLKTMLCS